MKKINSKTVKTSELRKFDLLENLFSPYDSGDMTSLVEYLKSGKDCVPMIVDKDHRVVDGYNRLKAYDEAGISDIQVDVYDYMDDEEMLEHAILLNAKRRHLDSVSLARYAIKLVELRKSVVDANPGERKPYKKKDDPEPPVVRGMSLTEKVARDLGVGAATVRQVAAVDATGDKDLQQAMTTEKLPIKEAAKIAAIRDPDERKAKLDETIVKREEDRKKRKEEKKALKQSTEKIVSEAGSITAVQFSELLGKARSIIEKGLEKMEWDDAPVEDLEKIKTEIVAINTHVNYVVGRIKPILSASKPEA